MLAFDLKVFDLKICQLIRGGICRDARIGALEAREAAALALVSTPLPTPYTLHLPSRDLTRAT